jgi:hypothetical protein
MVYLEKQEFLFINETAFSLCYAEADEREG